MFWLKSIILPRSVFGPRWNSTITQRKPEPSSHRIVYEMIYAESGVAPPDPKMEANRVRKYMPIGQIEAVDAASAFVGAASLAASWVERMDRRADGLRLLADHEDKSDPAE